MSEEYKVSFFGIFGVMLSMLFLFGLAGPIVIHIWRWLDRVWP
jgi:hypothetical protein